MVKSLVVLYWALAEAWHHIGNVYYFLMSTYNLIETLKDDTPIIEKIDTKGQISGYMSYRVNIDILDEDMETVMNALDFETLAECVGKYLRVTVELKRA